MNVNQVMVYGNLTRDPELKVLEGGSSITNMSIATNRQWKDKDGNTQEEVEYHNIVIFGRQAETCAEYLKRGSGAFVMGRLKTRNWEKDGVRQYRTEIVAERVQFGHKPSGENSRYNPNATEKPDGWETAVANPLPTKKDDTVTEKQPKEDDVIDWDEDDSF